MMPVGRHFYSGHADWPWMGASARQVENKRASRFEIRDREGEEVVLVRKIGVFQNWGLGDLVMTTPVIAELRRLYPDADITLVVRGKAQAALMAGSPVVDRVVEMPANKPVGKLLSFFMDLRKLKLDAAIVGTRITPAFAALLRFVSGVKVIVGDASKHRWLYTHVGEIDPQVHRVDRMLETLTLWTKQPPAAPQFPLPIPEGAQAQTSKLLEDIGAPQSGFLAIHPGSSKNLAGEKRIPVDTAKAMIAELRAKDPGRAVIILFGPDDLDLVPLFGPAQDGVFLVQNMPLGVTKALLSRAAAFVGSDSALGHIAAAAGVPTITMAGPTIPSETRPYGASASVLTRGERLDCQPCWGTPLHGKCPYNARCMTDIPATALYTEVSRALQYGRGVEMAELT